MSGAARSSSPSDPNPWDQPDPTPARRRPRPRNVLWGIAQVVGVVGVLFIAVVAVLFVVGILVFTYLKYNQVEWSVRACNESAAPLTLILTFDGPGGPQQQFNDLPASMGYRDQILIEERGIAKVHSIRVLGPAGNDQTFVVDEALPKGSDLSITVHADLSIDTSVDLDARVGF